MTTDATSHITYEMPVFFCPTELVLHPLADEMERGFISWMDRVGFAPTPQRRQELIDIKACALAASTTPWGAADRQQWFTNWAYWYWIPDKYADQGRGNRSTADIVRLAYELTRAIDIPNLIHLDNPELAAAAEASASFRRYGPPARVKRWRDAQRAHLFGVIHQVANAEQRRIPDVDEYLMQRLLDSGTLATLTTAEFTLATMVPSNVLESSWVRAITEMACMIVAIDNDIYSWPMEHHEEGNVQNIVNVIAHHQRLTRPEAVAAAVLLRDQIMLRFLRLTETPISDDGEGLGQYIRMLRNFPRANLHFGQTSPRYTRYYRRLPGGIRSLRVSERTTAPDAPLPYPNIAWWWNV